MHEVLYDLKVNHSKLNPVIVIGHGRSGTSILAGLLRKYLRINYGSESQFIVRFYKNLKYYGDLSSEANIKRLISDISQERCFFRWKKNFGFVLNPELVYKNLPERSYKGVLVSIFSQYADYHKMDRWGDKTPEYNHNLPILKELFPDAQYINITRDGRDVALSIYGLQFGGNNIYKTALEWKEQMELLGDFIKTLSKDQYIEIRYEDFLQNPVSVMSKFIDFLNIEDDDGELITFISDNIMNDLKKDNYYKWKSKMNSKNVALFERVAGDHLRANGYEVRNPGQPEISTYEKVLWEADNFIRKLYDIEYWKDNFYKLKVRYRSLKAIVRQINI